jgi:hypothetical protein
MRLKEQVHTEKQTAHSGGAHHVFQQLHPWSSMSGKSIRGGNASSKQTDPEVAHGSSHDRWMTEHKGQNRPGENRDSSQQGAATIQSFPLRRGHGTGASETDGGAGTGEAGASGV